MVVYFYEMAILYQKYMKQSFLTPDMTHILIKCMSNTDKLPKIMRYIFYWGLFINTDSFIKICDCLSFVCVTV